MADETTNTPEQMYGDLLSKTDVFDRMSKNYAADGDAFTATYAAWAADITVVQSVVLERVMLSSSRPDEQFLAVANTVTQAIAAYSGNPVVTTDAAESLANAREGLRAAFADSVMNLLYRRFCSLDHLQGITIPGPEYSEQLILDRTGGMSMDAFLRQKRTEAVDFMAAAEACLAEDDVVGAVTAAYQSDMATVEKYLMEAAIAVGDKAMITLHLRWNIACDAVAAMPELPRDFTTAVEQIRDYLLRSVGTQDAARLKARFVPIPTYVTPEEPEEAVSADAADAEPQDA